MKWYVAKLVFRICCGDGCHQPQFDEQLRLIAARNSAEALTKARRIGLSQEEVFLNVKGEPVRWQFVNIPEMNCLDVLADGLELYSRIKEADDADAYCTFVNRKAEALQQTGSINSQN